MTTKLKIGVLAVHVSVLFLFLLFTFVSTGCSAHPTPLRSDQDIQRASADTEQIVIGFLPIAHYPLLSKFKGLKDVSYFTTDGTGGSDDKLHALSKVRLENLKGVTLLNCPRVTDEGIRHLAQIPSLKWLGLEGTSITDAALATMVNDMKLTSVNVANCSNLTISGLTKLARSETLTGLTFSAEFLTQEDVVLLIMEFKQNLKWPDVVDLTDKLDAAHLKSVAQARGFKLRVSRTGAMQDLGLRKAQSPTGSVRK